MSTVSNFVFNAAKGQVVSNYINVYNNVPAGSALEVLLLSATGLEAQAILQDKTTLAALVSGTTREATNTGYARVVLLAASLAAPAPDQVDDWYAVGIPNQTWTAVAATGGAAAGPIGALVIAYRPALASPDSAIVPMTCHTFAVTPDGSDITAQIAAGGFYQAA